MSVLLNESLNILWGKSTYTSESLLQWSMDLRCQATIPPTLYEQLAKQNSSLFCLWLYHYSSPKNICRQVPLYFMSVLPMMLSVPTIVTKVPHINILILSWILSVYICHYFILQFCYLVYENNRQGSEAKPNQEIWWYNASTQAILSFSSLRKMQCWVRFKCLLSQYSADRWHNPYFSQSNNSIWDFFNLYSYACYIASKTLL